MNIAPSAIEHTIRVSVHGKSRVTTVAEYLAGPANDYCKSRVAALATGGRIVLGVDHDVVSNPVSADAYEYRMTSECHGCHGTGRQYRGSSECNGCSGLGARRVRL